MFWRSQYLKTSLLCLGLIGILPQLCYAQVEESWIQMERYS